MIEPAARRQHASGAVLAVWTAGGTKVSAAEGLKFGARRPAPAHSGEMIDIASGGLATPRSARGNAAAVGAARRSASKPGG